MVKTEQKEIGFDIYQPFGPSILKTKLPDLYVDALNKQTDKVLKDKKLSEERDWSHNLAGNVKKEISIDHMAIKTFPEFLATISQEYAKNVLPDYLPEGTKVSFRVWAVSQVAGDFNPMHIHDSNLSGVCFLKVPPNYEEEYKKEDHHPTAGCLEFLGSVPNHFARHSFLVKPEVGDFYLFPSWLTHQVYPFRSEGERRSMAFNVHFSMENPLKGVNV
jgi:uncharacterized protein (TIGR02466 family)|tara:strand:+ start:63 stop:716 length:654 start_codon:yes stop_codon:yes gene_type:complete